MDSQEIKAQESGQRFDKYLSRYLKEAPKSFLYKMLRKKNITLNGKKANGNEKLEVNDKVQLFFSDETLEKFMGEEKEVKKGSLEILYEDENVIFINKPAGMLSQKAKKEDVFSIVDSSFMPCGVECDQYQVVGEILELEEEINHYTKETVYIMVIECNNLSMTVAVNKADLLGEPAVGRRFKGQVWLQGSVAFKG